MGENHKDVLHNADSSFNSLARRVTLRYSYLRILLSCVSFISLVFLVPAAAHAQQADGGKAVSLYKESVQLLNDGNVDKAVEVAKEAVKSDPEYAEAYEQLGDALYKKKQYDEALSAYNSALKINPLSHLAKIGLGLALLKKGDANSAETVLKEAVRANPYPSMAYYALGLVYEKLNDYDKAVYHFKEGIRTYKSGKK